MEGRLHERKGAYEIGGGRGGGKKCYRYNNMAEAMSGMHCAGVNLG